MRVEIDSVSATVTSHEDIDGLLKVVLVPPRRGSAGLKSAFVSVRDLQAQTVAVNFEFSYRPPTPYINPVDGPVAGGTPVTITAIGWGAISTSLTSESDVIVEFGGEEATVVLVESVESSDQFSAVTVVVLAPRGSVGEAQCTIRPSTSEAGSSSKLTFLYTYFNDPYISSIGESRFVWLDGLPLNVCNH